MPVEKIPPSQWKQFLDGYCRQHEGWLASFAGAGQDATKPLPLRDIRLECTDAHDRVVLCFDDRGSEIAHAVPHPRALRAVRTDDGAHAGLEIESEDGDVSALRFRVPARPETLDGMAPGERPHRSPRRAA